jgi:protein gp37
MGESTGISWTDKTWNPLIGCSRVSAGCQHCYAERFAHRGLAPQHRGLTTMSKSGLHWKKPRAVFVNSMSDLFHEKATFEYIAAVFGVMAASPQHTFVILTKRDPRKWFEWIAKRPAGLLGMKYSAKLVCAALAMEQLGDAWHWSVPNPMEWPLPNVVIGVSCENQSTADERIPWLLQTPAAKRVVSLEPLLGPIDLTHLDSDAAGGSYCQVNALTGRQTDMGRPCEDVSKLDGVIVGGESDTNARPCNIEWIRSIGRQCMNAGVPFFPKQLGTKAYAERNESWCNAHPNNMHLVRATHDGLYDVSLNLKDRKGADMSEWPTDLRMRELPWRLSCSKS